jgi:hypothetical protein
MALSYEKRKLQGQILVWEHRKKMNHALHLATMLRGVTLASSFCFVMFAIAGITTTLDIVLEIGTMVLGGFTMLLAEHILFTAEQSRYPKNRRRTLRSEIVDEWREFRLSRQKS